MIEWMDGGAYGGEVKGEVEVVRLVPPHIPDYRSLIAVKQLSQTVF